MTGESTPTDGGRFDAIVIGSGFGGAVASCRLAQAGFGVCVLERGRRYRGGGFPRSRDPSHGWMYGVKERGLFDLKPIATEMLTLQAAGWGGGSLIYNSVNMRPPDDLFASGWPEGYRRATLDPYYDLVAYMLDVKPIAATQPRGLPPKTLRMAAAAAAMGREGQLFHPNLAVDFGPPGEPHPNRFGVEQRGCTHCGECYFGCNERAKNTLDLNYLALAERHGAVARTECEVLRIEPSGDGYLVTYLDHAAGGRAVRVEARWVFVCAGAVNSTELLLRARDEHGTLPRLGDTLGHRYSANGDFLAVAYGLRERSAPSTGPGITAAMAYKRDGAWVLVQDGNGPPLVNLVAELFNPRHGTRDAIRILSGEIPGTALGIPRARRPVDERADHCLPLFAMGRDSADGQLYIEKESGRLRLRWELGRNLPFYGAEVRLCADTARALGGEAQYNPFWRLLDQPLTVHSLGGCPMADDAAGGVLDGHGEVYGHPGLFVLDGAALPAATGANPSATIAAVAERNIERFIRRVTQDPEWRAPERALATPVPEPLDRVVFPPGGSHEPGTPPIGLSFRETLSGDLTLGHLPTADHAGGETGGGACRCALEIVVPDLDAFLADASHAAVARGTLEIEGLTSAGGAEVHAGVLNVLTPGERPDERRFRYVLPFRGTDGEPYALVGRKDITRARGWDPWHALTTLHVVVRRGHEGDGALVATGVLRFSLAGIPEMVRSLSTTGAAGALEKAAAVRRIGRVLGGPLWNVYAPR
jgi:cholesterol oxidase